MIISLFTVIFCLILASAVLVGWLEEKLRDADFNK